MVQISVGGAPQYALHRLVSVRKRVHCAVFPESGTAALNQHLKRFDTNLTPGEAPMASLGALLRNVMWGGTMFDTRALQNDWARRGALHQLQPPKQLVRLGRKPPVLHRANK